MKPCPFCGSVDLRTSTTSKIEDNKFVCQIQCIQCMFCGAEGPKKFYVNDPVSKWDDRSDD